MVDRVDRFVPHARGRESKSDAVDRRIIDLLTRNARMSAAEIGRRLGYSRTAVQARIRRLEADGRLRYTLSRPEESRAVDSHRAVMLIFRWQKHSVEAFKRGLRRIDAVTRSEVMSGDLDMCVWLEAATQSELLAAIHAVSQLPGPGSVRFGTVERSWQR